MPGDGALVAVHAGQQPAARGLRVGHGLQRGEGLRGDDEQRLRGVEIAHRLGEIGAVDVGHEAEGHGAVAVVLQRLVGHHRPEIRSADADVDHIADALAGVALPGAAAHPLGEIRHPVQNGMNLGHDVAAVMQDRGAARRAQRNVEHRAVLGDVDLVAAEHRLDAVAQPGLLGELEQQTQGFIGDTVLGVVEIDAGGLASQPLPTLGVLGEELPQMQALHSLVVLLQRHPSRERAQHGDPP